MESIGSSDTSDMEEVSDNSSMGDSGDDSPYNSDDNYGYDDDPYSESPRYDDDSSAPAGWHVGGGGGGVASLAMPDVVSGSWACPACTFVNDASSAACTVCQVGQRSDAVAAGAASPLAVPPMATDSGPASASDEPGEPPDVAEPVSAGAEGSDISPTPTDGEEAPVLPDAVSEAAAGASAAFEAAMNEARNALASARAKEEAAESERAAADEASKRTREESIASAEARAKEEAALFPDDAPWMSRSVSWGERIYGESDPETIAGEKEEKQLRGLQHNIIGKIKHHLEQRRAEAAEEAAERRRAAELAAEQPRPERGGAVLRPGLLSRLVTTSGSAVDARLAVVDPQPDPSERCVHLTVGVRRRLFKVRYTSNLSPHRPRQLFAETDDDELKEFIFELNRWLFSASGHDGWASLVSALLDHAQSVYDAVRREVEHHEVVMATYGDHETSGELLSPRDSPDRTARIAAARPNPEGGRTRGGVERQTSTTAYDEVWSVPEDEKESGARLRPTEAKMACLAQLKAVCADQESNNWRVHPENPFFWSVALMNFDVDTTLGRTLAEYGLLHNTEPVVKLRLKFPDTFPDEPPVVFLHTPIFEDNTGGVVNGVLMMPQLYPHPVGTYNPEMGVKSLLLLIRTHLREKGAVVNTKTANSYPMRLWSASYQRVMGQYRGPGEQRATTSDGVLGATKIVRGFPYSIAHARYNVRVPPNFHYGNRLVFPSNLAEWIDQEKRALGFRDGWGATPALFESTPRSGLRMPIIHGQLTCTAPDSVLVFPDDMFRGLGLEPGQEMTIRMVVGLAKLTKMTPVMHEPELAERKDAAYLIQANLSVHQSLTVGEQIEIRNYDGGGDPYHITIAGLEPVTATTLSIWGGGTGVEVIPIEGDRPRNAPLEEEDAISGMGPGGAVGGAGGAGGAAGSSGSDNPVVPVQPLPKSVVLEGPPPRVRLRFGILQPEGAGHSTVNVTCSSSTTAARLYAEAASLLVKSGHRGAPWILLVNARTFHADAVLPCDEQSVEDAKLKMKTLYVCLVSSIEAILEMASQAAAAGKTQADADIENAAAAPESEGPYSVTIMPFRGGSITRSFRFGEETTVGDLFAWTSIACSLKGLPFRFSIRGRAVRPLREETRGTLLSHNLNGRTLQQVIEPESVCAVYDAKMNRRDRQSLPSTMVFRQECDGHVTSHVLGWPTRPRRFGLCKVHECEWFSQLLRLYDGELPPQDAAKINVDLILNNLDADYL